MMKKILICLCLILSLCACTQSSIESDIADNEIVETEEDIQTNEEDTVDNEDIDEDISQTDDESESSGETTIESNNNQSTSSNSSSSTSTTNSSSSTFDNSSSTSNSTSTTSSNNNTTEITEETKIYCTYTIECSSILDYTDVLQSNYQVPSNGIIYSQTVEIEDDDTVMSILKRTGVSTDISLGYVKGIDGLYEFDCGSESGWTYSVNGTKPNVGASKYSVSDGDVIKWTYVVTRSEW